ncbi:MAG TPA: hypothetical protein VG125_32095 [Pirellulales bacterium]|nr:hypothetical protein [Pirellulales bacterium]
MNVIDRDLIGRDPDDAAVPPTGDRIAEPLVHQKGLTHCLTYRGFNRSSVRQKLA